jgi:hypothetical protein
MSRQSAKKAANTQSSPQERHRAFIRSREQWNRRVDEAVDQLEKLAERAKSGSAEEEHKKSSGTS